MDTAAVEAAGAEQETAVKKDIDNNSLNVDDRVTERSAGHTGFPRSGTVTLVKNGTEQFYVTWDQTGDKESVPEEFTHIKFKKNRNLSHIWKLEQTG